MRKADVSPPEAWAEFLRKCRERRAASPERIAKHREYNRARGLKANMTHEQWATRREYMRRYKAQHRERFAQQQRDSQRRRLADPEKRAHYNGLQRGYYRRKEYRMPRRGNFTAQLFDRLRELQQGRCAVCGREFCQLPGKRREHRDHDHETGEARGLLCLACNTIEGMLKKLQLSPLEFAHCLHDYLADPPVARLRRSATRS